MKDGSLQLWPGGEGTKHKPSFRKLTARKRLLWQTPLANAVGGLGSFAVPNVFFVSTPTRRKGPLHRVNKSKNKGHAIGISENARM